MDVVGFLTSDRARAALDQLSEESRFDPARDVPRLRRWFSSEQSAALAELLAGRPLARVKFGGMADRMLYTVEAIRQATPMVVATHRASRFSGHAIIADLGCGIGGDALAFQSPVVGIDIDHDRVAMAVHNVALFGGRLVGVRGNLSTLPPFSVSAGFADPARRDEAGRRVFDVHKYRPPLRLLLEQWLRLIPNLAVKVHPGVRHEQLPTSAEAEFVSLNGHMREACLWFGDLRSDARFRATVLPSGTTITGDPLAMSAPASTVGDWLFEPDPAVLRAGLVGDLAARFELGAIDPSIAYLTADHSIISPLLTGYRVDAAMPFNAKKIRAYLRTRGVGHVVVKKRGSAVDPEEFRRGLRLAGDASRIVVLTRVARRPTAIICHAGTDVENHSGLE